MAQYKDIDFNFTKNSFTGDLNTVQDAMSIKQSIKNIVLSYKGERTLNYEFGASVQDVLFEPSNTPNIAILSEIDVRIRASEPRINLKSVQYDYDSLTPSIVINYEYTLENGDTAVQSTTISTYT